MTTYDENMSFQHGIGAMTTEIIEYGARSTMNLPMLTKTNYLHWKFRMEFALGRKGLMDIVLGQDPKPANPELRRQWEQKDYQARELIVMSVGHDQDTYIFRAKSAKEMWDNLQTAYQEKSTANSIELKGLFYNLKKKQEHTINDHINRMWEIIENMSALGVEVPEEDKVMVLLDSIPS